MRHTSLSHVAEEQQKSAVPIQFQEQRKIRAISKTLLWLGFDMKPTHGKFEPTASHTSHGRYHI